jgi:Domain of unknown function (DUF4326)
MPLAEEYATSWCQERSHASRFQPSWHMACLPFDFMISTIRPTMPSRIQRRRSRGWRQPISAIYVVRPIKWGNPSKVGTGHHTVDEAVSLYRRDLIARSFPFTIDDARGS